MVKSLIFTKNWHLKWIHSFQPKNSSMIYELKGIFYTKRKSVVFFYFPGKVAFRMIFGIKEWVSEISGIFFFHSGGKKNTELFLTQKKIPDYFSVKLSISDRKKQRYFSKLSTPIFLPRLWITDEKTKIIFWPKLGISDGNKKIPPYFCKNCLFLAEIKKYQLFLPKPLKSTSKKFK